MDGWRFHIFSGNSGKLLERQGCRLYFGRSENLVENSVAFDFARVKAQKSHAQTREIW